MAVSAPNDTPTYAPSALPGAPPPVATIGYMQPVLPGAAPAAAATTIPISRPAVWTGAYAPSEIHTALVNAGVPPSVAPTLTAISGAESGLGKNTVIGVNKDGSRDYGVFQVNNKAWPQFGGADVAKLPLDQQAKLAAEIYRKQGLSAWSTYNNGAYKSHLNGASPATSGAPPPGAAAPGAAAKPSFADAAQKGDVGAMLQALTAEDAKEQSPGCGSSQRQFIPERRRQRTFGWRGAASGPHRLSGPAGGLRRPGWAADGPGDAIAERSRCPGRRPPFGSGAGMVPGTALNS